MQALLHSWQNFVATLAPVAVIGGMKIGTSFFGDPEPGVLLTQTAIFAPKGLLGFVYWYALYPAGGTFAMHPIRPDKTARVT
jgi:hypothetical protein